MPLYLYVQVSRTAGEGKRTKERRLLGLVCPAQQHLLHQLAEAAAVAEQEGGGFRQLDYSTQARPLCGVAGGKKGLVLFKLYLDTARLAVSRNLTFESLMSRLHAAGAASPLLLHQGLKEFKLPGATRGRTVNTAISSWLSTYCKNEHGSVRYFCGQDQQAEFMAEALRELDLPPDYKVTLDFKDDSCGPRPPYLTTVTQLGLTNAAGIPNLINSMLPPGCPPLCYEWVLRLLQLPPPPDMAMHVHQVGWLGPAS